MFASVYVYGFVEEGIAHLDSRARKAVESQAEEFGRAQVTVSSVLDHATDLCVGRAHLQQPMELLHTVHVWCAVRGGAVLKWYRHKRTRANTHINEITHARTRAHTHTHTPEAA